MRWIWLTVFLAGCTGNSLAVKSDKYQMEMTLHKTRAYLEEMKHDLHTQRMELSILEGKMVNHEDQMAAIMRDTFDLHKTKLEGCHTQIVQLEKRFTQMEAKQDEVLGQLQKLAAHTQEMTKALAQNKERVGELERSLTAQTASLKTIQKTTEDN